jgi:nucleoside 2-deoxyribosyltransferase
MKKLKIFFAGELFDHKHLTGNFLLAEQIEKKSKNRFTCLLPQNLESNCLSCNDLRKADLELLISSDMIIFNFDGGDIDSGTAIEFAVCKALNKPALLFRSDFRNAGDQQDGDPWNLMCSGYPGTEKLIINAMEFYKKYKTKSAQKTAEALYSGIAELIIQKLSALASQIKPLNKEMLKSIRKSYALD